MVSVALCCSTTAMAMHRLCLCVSVFASLCFSVFLFSVSMYLHLYVSLSHLRALVRCLLLCGAAEPSTQPSRRLGETISNMWAGPNCRVVVQKDDAARGARAAAGRHKDTARGAQLPHVRAGTRYAAAVGCCHHPHTSVELAPAHFVPSVSARPAVVSRCGCSVLGVRSS